MSVAEAVAAARGRNYRDADDAPTFVDWADPVARTALALDTMSYETPERVLIMLESSRPQMEATWARKFPADRQLLRRRAAILLEIGAGT